MELLQKNEFSKWWFLLYGLSLYNLQFVMLNFFVLTILCLLNIFSPSQKTIVDMASWLSCSVGICSGPGSIFLGQLYKCMHIIYNYDMNINNLFFFFNNINTGNHKFYTAWFPKFWIVATHTHTSIVKQCFRVSYIIT